MYSISIALGDNSKAYGDKTDGKKTFNHTAGKVWGYR